jgi:hypothetical protein
LSIWLNKDKATAVTDALDCGLPLCFSWAYLAWR